MRRSIEQYKNSCPKTMAHDMSDNAKQFAFEDAKSDIIELYEENIKMRELLRIIAYPCRGTNEEDIDIYSASEMIQAHYTSEQLEIK
jgi:hypothetical protein